MALPPFSRPKGVKYFYEKYPLNNYEGDSVVAGSLESPRLENSSPGYYMPQVGNMTQVEAAQFDPEFPLVHPQTRAGAVLQEEALRNARLRARAARNHKPEDPYRFIPAAFRQAMWGQW